ncbi:acyl transferase [Flavobacteriaceae bacterium]|nr:acyl transferase [Flavobacteriaceae bacterium]
MRNLLNTNFEQAALETFYFQAAENPVYQKFLNFLGKNPNEIRRIEDIPFMPISFFKDFQVTAGNDVHQQVFLSSGTTGMSQSKHFVKELSWYEESYLTAFEEFYGTPEDLVILALLPAYLEREGSSLIYMVDDLIKRSKQKESGFYLNNLDELAQTLNQLDQEGKQVLLIGVSFALLDLLDKYQFRLQNTIIMETGGMKGRRKEMIRAELHEVLSTGFGVDKIHSEYGMTELLSQAYSKGDGIFYSPSWMRILIRDPEDALSLLPTGKGGGINVIDLANRFSCSFIATQDLGRMHEDGGFEILGRFDNSDIRGCNLLVQ